ncbi:hypothetical protein SRHO_G00083200 [Serrasalmus rhombeus]
MRSNRSQLAQGSAPFRYSLHWIKNTLTMRRSAPFAFIGFDAVPFVRPLTGIPDRKDSEWQISVYNICGREIGAAVALQLHTWLEFQRFSLGQQQWAGLRVRDTSELQSELTPVSSSDLLVPSFSISHVAQHHSCGKLVPAGNEANRLRRIPCEGLLESALNK